MSGALNSALAAAGISVTVAVSSVSSMDTVEGLPVDLPNTPPSNKATADENITKISRADTADIAVELAPPPSSFSTTSMLGSFVTWCCGSISSSCS